jgi:hypothetical protein
MADFLDAYEGVLHEQFTPAGQHALIWCIENKLLMGRAAGWGIVLVYYEDLLDASDESAWQSLVTGLGLKNVPDTESRRSASQQASRLTSERGYNSGHCGGWRSRLSPVQIDEIQRVLDAFEIDQYNMNSMLPSRRMA